MKKLLAIFPMLLLALAFVSAESLTLNSGTSDEYKDGSNWYPAVPVNYIHPSWISNINLPGSVWIWDKEDVTLEEAQYGSTVLFKRDFNLPKCLENIEGTITLTTDNAFVLRVNGNLVGTDANWFDSHTYDISSYLGSDENTITIEATNEAMNGGTPTTNPAGVIYTAEISYDRTDCETEEVPVDQEIPEFGVVAGALALIAGLGIVAYKRN